MPKLLLLMALLMGSRGCLGQQGMPHYYEYLRLTHRADSLASRGQFRAAAGLSTRAARVPVERAIPVSRAETRYQAARYWALGSVADSAFGQLKTVAQLGYAQPDTLRRDAELARLHADARWPALLAQVAANAARERRLDAAYRERNAFAGPAGEVVFSPPKAYLRQFIYNDTLPLISVNYGNFRLFFRGNSYTAAHLPAVQAQLTSALARIYQVLQIPTYPKGIYLLLVDSRQELRELTDMSPGGGLALAGYDAVFLVNNPARRLQARHEIFHLIASEVWGNTQSRLLNEGAAVYADNECWYENPLYSLNAYLLRTGQLLPMQQLITNFDLAAQQGEVVAYLQSAGIFKYLYETYGRAKMQQLWLAGFGSFARIYGFSLARLAREWRAFIEKTPIPPQVDWAKVSREGCG